MNLKIGDIVSVSDLSGGAFLAVVSFNKETEMHLIRVGEFTVKGNPPNQAQTTNRRKMKVGDE